MFVRRCASGTCDIGGEVVVRVRNSERPTFMLRFSYKDMYTNKYVINFAAGCVCVGHSHSSAQPRRGPDLRFLL